MLAGYTRQREFSCRRVCAGDHRRPSGSPGTIPTRQSPPQLWLRPGSRAARTGEGGGELGLRTPAVRDCFLEKGPLRCVPLTVGQVDLSGDLRPVSDQSERHTDVTDMQTSVLCSFFLGGHVCPCGFNSQANTDGSHICVRVPRPATPVRSGMAQGWPWPCGSPLYPPPHRTVLATGLH